jgi:hypothetical protein
VHHQARLRLRGRHFPQFLDADRVALRVAAFVESVARDQLLAQVAARAFGEHGVLRGQLHAELEAVVRLAVLADAQVAGGHSAHRAALVVEDLGGGEAGKDLDAQRLGHAAQPLHQRAERDDVVPLVVEAPGHHRIGHPARMRGAEEQHVVAGDGLVQRCALRLPVGDQLGDRARVHHRAREDVRSRLAALLEHHDRDRRVELLQPDGRGQPRGAGADDHHVVLHGLSRAVSVEQFLGGHGVSE